MIQINKIDENNFEVAIAANVETKHAVTLDDQYWQKLTGGAITKEELIEKSFSFLLEREPNTSILKSFNLTVIAEYFPEYETKIMI